MNNAPLTFDFVVWTNLFNHLYFKHGAQPWVAAARTTSIPRLCRRRLELSLNDSRGRGRSYAATLVRVQDYLAECYPQFFEASRDGWAEASMPERQPRDPMIGVDGVVWEICHEVMIYRCGVPPWVAAARLATIPRSVVDDLIQSLLGAGHTERGRAAALRAAEEFLARHLPDLLSPSDEEWA